MGTILVLAASFLTFERSQYYFGLVRISAPELMYSRTAKTLTSFLVFLLALSVGDDGIDASDLKRLCWCFIAVFAGDLLFLLDEVNPLFDLATVVMFLVAHLLIIVRNGHGARDYLRRSSTTKQRVADILSGILILTYLLFTATLLAHLRGSPLLYILAAYAVVLDVSLWVGWASLRIGYFRKSNAVLVTAGATCFFLRDYLVGFNLSLEPSIWRATTVFMMWIFYAPAHVLFALVGYCWNSRRCVEVQA
jgi:hypothetical protein